MKHRFPLLLLLLVVTLSAWYKPPINFAKSWKKYQDTLRSCNCLSMNAPLSTLNQLDADIREMLMEVREQKTKAFTTIFLRTSIERTRLQIAVIKYKRGAMTFSQLRSVVEDLMVSKNLYADQGEAFTALGKENCSSEEMKCLGLAELTQAAFDTSAWRSYATINENLIYEVEEQVFLQMVPEITVRRLDEFIQLAPYHKPPKTHNHKVNEAFLLYYKLLTADGETVTVEEFERHIRTGKGDAFWLSLFINPDFQQKYQEDLGKTHTWNLIVTNPNVQESGLETVIREAAPRDIALVALLKRLKPLLDKQKFQQAAQYALAYQSDFTEKMPYANMDKKYRQLLRLLQRMEMDKTQEYHFKSSLVSELQQGHESVEFFFNADRSVLAIMPKFMDPINIFKRSSRGEFVHQRSYNGDPEKKFYTFLQSDPRIRDSILELDHRSIKLDEIGKGATTSSDLYMSYKHNLAFFVSLSGAGRQDTVNQSAEYASPWLVPSVDMKDPFQEYDHQKKFHGKSSGNLNTDIYYTVRVSGNWQRPRLFRQSNGDQFRVNTPFCERSPVLSPDGKYLYFSSEGHESLGGFDVYRVPITVQGTQVNTSGSVEHVSGVNTTADELFFNPINDSLAYFSTNRKSDKFRIHRLQKIQGKDTDMPPPPPLPPIKRDQLMDIGGEIDLEAHCIEQPEADESLNGKEIMLLGRIYDKKLRLMQKAKICFYPRNRNQQCSYVDLSKGDSIYQVILPTDSRSIQIKVIGLSPENDTITAIFNTRLDTLCDNESRKYRFLQDHILEPITDVVQNQRPVYVPVFFDTNVGDRSINIETNMMVYFRDEFNDFAKNKIKFHFVGYADERGSKEHNLVLSQQRANTVRNFFLSRLGYTEKKSNAIAAGKTKQFNNDNWKQYKTYIPEYFESKYGNGQEKIWFQNRRVMIYYTY